MLIQSKSQVFKADRLPRRFMSIAGDTGWLGLGLYRISYDLYGISYDLYGISYGSLRR